MELNDKQLESLKRAVFNFNQSANQTIQFDPLDGMCKVIRSDAYDDPAYRCPDRIIPLASKDAYSTGKGCSANIEALLDVIAMIDPKAPPFKGMFEMLKIEWNEPKIKTYRRRKGMTQKQLAEAAGVSSGEIAKLEYFERDFSGVSLGKALRIAEALGVDPKALI